MHAKLQSFLWIRASPAPEAVRVRTVQQGIQFPESKIKTMALPLANSPDQNCNLRPTNTAIRRFCAPRPLLLWHLASLDAPTVAVAWSLGFAWAAGVRLPLWVPVLLSLGTWAVYIGDRLLDARAAMRSGNLHRLRERHFFHWRHRRILAPLALVAAGAAAAIIFNLMPATVREHNSVLAVAALAYFSGVHTSRRAFAWGRSIFSKELLVGVLFTAGCALPALSRLATTTFGWSLGSLLAACTFFAFLAWLNCGSIEHWESGKISGRISIAGRLLCLFGLLLALFLFPTRPNIASLIAAGSASSFLLVLLDRLRGRLTPLALRAAADLVLLTPLLLLAR